MAIAKTARLIAAETVGPNTRHLSLEMEEPLGHRGGQYVIVDSGIVLPNGKSLKRPYSILSADTDLARFELAVRKLDGPMSAYMHEVAVGSTITFSGPWGKLLTCDEPGGHVLVVATDTGITAALGLVRGSAFHQRLSTTTLVWFATSADDFVPEGFVRDRLPEGCAFRVEPFPPVGHPERPFVVRDRVRTDKPGRAYLVGDGIATKAMSETLLANGVAPSDILIECFFNNPAKRAA